ncbi:MAG: DUF4230 domain-containing protein [Paludibacteraceae bacterium]|nr:DUF4230 domain-containing protein [Paludibacteraceae bacterium]MBP5481650.1 DUF4230 domain-containing protein [Paludibacteraceae bacterium]
MAKKIIILLLSITVCVLAFFLLRGKDSKTRNVQMDISTEISSIKEVAEWEFLTVEMEEFEDTVIPRSIVSDDQFARIYKGTARLGIDMKEAQAGWVTASHDTVRIQLPAIRILDEEIIDDMQTRTFYENGSITPAIKTALYERAKRDMRLRAMSKENISAASGNAKAQFTYMFRSMGFKTVLFE